MPPPSGQPLEWSVGVRRRPGRAGVVPQFPPGPARRSCRESRCAPIAAPTGNDGGLQPDLPALGAGRAVSGALGDHPALRIEGQSLPQGWGISWLTQGWGLHPTSNNKLSEQRNSFVAVQPLILRHIAPVSRERVAPSHQRPGPAAWGRQARACDGRPVARYRD